MRSKAGRSLLCIAAGLVVLLWPMMGNAAGLVCDGDAAWIENPSLPDFTKEPAGLCLFNQMSWQTFLYLVQPVKPGGKVLRFETYDSVGDIFGSNAGGQKATASACADQDERNGGRRRTFLPRVRKDRTPGTQQALSRGVLVDQQGEVTLYETYFDPTFASFIDACDLTNKACETVDPALAVPVGTLQLKVSWRPIRRDDPSYARFYTIQDVTYEDPQTGKCATRDVAMVGFHLVYAPKNHPELVWATFEHVANAPDGPCAGPTTPPAGFAGWTYNDARSTDCAKINQWDNPQGPPYPATQVFRNWAYGTNTTNTFSPHNIESISTLNRSVATLLSSKSVWSNYFLVGSVWTVQGILPAVAPTPEDLIGNLAGSALLANSTMETFEQSPNPLTGAAAKSCFSCHNTSPANPQPVHVTHSITNATPADKCSWDLATQPAACKATQPAKAAAQAFKPLASH